MSRQSNFIPVDKLKIKCPVCNDHKWCCVTADLTAVKCRNPISRHLPSHNYVAKPTRVAITGTLYVLRDLSTVDNYRPEPIIYTPKQEEPEQDFSELAKTAYMRADRKKYAHSLGVTEESCSLLRVGLMNYYRKEQGMVDAWAIPLRNADMKVIGIRLEYCSDRVKWAVKGTKNGLIMFPDMQPCEEPLYSPEGCSDSLSLRDLGIKHIAGRPGNMTGLKYLVEYGKKCYRPLILIADRDAAGLAGCKHIAAGVGRVFKSIKIVTPPPGYKDLRAWYNSGKASLDKLMFLINNTEEYVVKTQP